jgi:hypothetical protein
MIEKCNLCDERYEYETSSGMSRKFCRYCFDKIKISSRRVAIKDILGGECRTCGSEPDCYSKLSLHHRENKKFEFSGKLTRISYKRISTEMKKCDLLCENCHTKRHCEGSRDTVQNIIGRVTVVLRMAPVVNHAMLCFFVTEDETRQLKR